MAKIACLKYGPKKLFELQSGKRRCAHCRMSSSAVRVSLTADIFTISSIMVNDDTPIARKSLHRQAVFKFIAANLEKNRYFYDEFGNS